MELSGGKMKIEEFNSGVWEQGYKYKYFVPAFINHPFSWEDDAISIISRKSGQKIPKIANLQYYKSKANYGTKKKGISR